MVLDQIDRQSAIGKRDYAMIVLTARLGLRVGDLRRLELGWEFPIGNVTATSYLIRPIR